MTRDEAKLQMQKGVRMTHRFFEPHEWVTMFAGQVMFENELLIDEDVFWRNHRTKEFLIDWEFFDKDYTTLPIIPNGWNKLAKSMETATTIFKTARDVLNSLTKKEPTYLDKLSLVGIILDLELETKESAHWIGKMLHHGIASNQISNEEILKSVFEMWEDNSKEIEKVISEKLLSRIKIESAKNIW